MNNRYVNMFRYIFTVGLGIFMLNRIWNALDAIQLDWVRMSMNLGTGLAFGIKIIIYMAMLGLCIMVFQNLLRLYIEIRYKDDANINEAAKKLIQITNRIKIYQGYVVLMVFLLLMGTLACIALFAPGVKNRDSGVYGAGIFMLVVVVMVAFWNIKSMVKIHKQHKEDRNSEDTI